VDRTTVLRVIAIGFFFYALYTASFLTGMLVGPTRPILLIGAVAKTALALACAIGIWTGQRWAPAVIVLAGLVIAVLWLLYGFVLGFVAYLYGRCDGGAGGPRDAARGGICPADHLR
jgi:hypothetical protein